VEGQQTAPVTIQPGSVVEKGLVVGAVVGGRYELRALLGEGGMGAVFLAHDEVLGADVALKFVLRDLTHREQDLRRLRAEVLLAQRASHPNVCRTYDLEELDGLLFIKMEYVAGETLARRLAREAKVSIDELLRLARAITAGLEAAHAQGVVHCDLKPENILIEHGTKRPVLMDFGIARATARGTTSGDSLFWGTPAYMAPEQLSGGSVDARTDLYALGCVLYQLAVGEVPYPEVTSSRSALHYLDEPIPDPRVRRPDLPFWLAAIIRKLLVKDPRQRYPHAAALRAALAGPLRLEGRRLWIPFVAAVVLGLGAIGVYRSMGHKVEWHADSRVRVPAYEEHAGSPNISPDGRWLAYISDREGPWRLYVEPISGGPARVLPWEGLLYPVRWAHDSQSLLGVVYKDARVVRVPMVGGAVEEVARPAVDVADCKGRLVLRTRGDGQCATCYRWTAQEGTGEGARWREILRVPEAAVIRAMHCDPSGRQLTFAALLQPQTGGMVQQADIYVLDIDSGSLRRLTFDHYYNDHPKFAPDGKTIIFSSNRSGAHELWEIPVQGGVAMPLTSSGGHTKSLPFDITPDGKLLIYNHESEADQLYAYRLDSPDRRRISHPLSQKLRQPFVTPDGRQLVILVTRQEKSYAVVLPLTGGEERILTAADAVALGLDGTELIFALNEEQGARILAMPLGGGEARRITHAPGPVSNLAVDREGWVHLAIRQGSARGGWRAPLAGGEAVRESAPGALLVLPAPVGGWQLVGFERPDKGFRWRLMGPGQPPPPPPLSEDPRSKASEAGLHVAWASDGKSWFSWNGTEIYRRFLAGRPEQLILRTELVNGMTVSSNTNTLFVVEDAGHTVRQVIANFGDRPRPVK
jgi:serine/threonine protein kinase